MKQKLLLKVMLLLFALIAGSSSVWAGDTWEEASLASLTSTDVFVIVGDNYAMTNDKGTSSAPATVAVTVTGGKITSTVDDNMKWNVSGNATDGYTFYPNGSTTTWLYCNTTASSGSNNNMRVGTGNRKVFELNNSNIIVTKDDNTARYLSIYNNADWRGYVNTNSAPAVKFYKKVSSGNSCATPTFSPAAGVYTSTQNVIISTTTEGATIYYTTNGSTPTNSSTPYTGAIPVSSTTTIKAIAVKTSYDDSSVASATYTILEHAGTEADPYSVADARNAIDANTGISDVYATGIVSEIVTAYDSEHKNISFNISADGLTTSAQLQAYRCKKGDGGSDPDVDGIQVGDVVIVKGNLTKFSSTYEFAQDNVLISLDRPTTPLIIVTPTSLTGFTYGVGFGPSDAKTFSVEGSNLTANITLSLGVSSNYEMSLTENGVYSNELSLTPTTGTVTATDIYVRLKAGLALNASYEGTVSLTSTGATDKAVSLAGSVTQPNFTWNLATNSYSAASTTQVTWTGTYATMVADKGSSTTNANNYLPTSQSSSRFYKDSYLTIAPTSGYTITSIEFTATTEGYATSLKNSTWTNATAVASVKTVTITPTNGVLPISATIGNTCGFTAVKVYYGVVTSVPLTPAKTYTTLTSSHNLDFTSVSSVLEAYIIKDNDTSDGYVTLTQVNKVPAGTGLVLKATTPGSPVSVPVFDGTDPDDVSGNKMAGSATETTAIAANAGYILSDGVFQPSSGGTLAAGKAYLNIAVPTNNAPALKLDFGGATGINTVQSSEFMVKGSDIYNLKGQKVSQPSKGLYIVNGRKVVIK